MISFENEQIYDFREEVRDLLAGVPCVLAVETAADYGGYWCGYGAHPLYYIYVTEPQNIPKTKEYLVPSLEDIDWVEEDGVRYTTHQQTIIDLLREDSDQQIIQEVLADWYFGHNRSYDGLTIPGDIMDRYKTYAEWAKEYYIYG